MISSTGRCPAHHPGDDILSVVPPNKPPQDAVLPLVPYLDTLRWVFIALAQAGIAVAVWARLGDWKKGLR